MSTLDKNLQRRREDCRRDVLAWLVERAYLAFRLAAIRTGVERQSGVAYAEDEILAVLIFWQGATPPHVERLPDTIGTQDKYRCTHAGQIAYERAEYGA